MTYRDHLEKVRTTVRESLNAFLESRGLGPMLHFTGNGFDVEASEMSVAVYAASPDGEVLRQTDDGFMCFVTVEFFVNQSADAISMDITERYFSAIAEYLSSTHFGEYDTLQTADIVRMDLGAGSNGGLFLLGSRIQSLNDYWL